VAGAAFGVATLAGPVFAAADGKKTFTILHINDMHSAFIGLGPASDYTPFKPDDDETGACRSQAVQPLNKGPKLKIKKPDRTRVPSGTVNPVNRCRPTQST
jgi:hypothetical protein